jgi:ribulose-phosphate 3-epimerase
MSTKGIRILPSILSARMGHLADDCRRALDAGADGLHFDVMDGHFVANLTLGPDVLRALRDELPGAWLHVHLMVDRPDFYAPRFIDAGADTVLVHAESPCDIPSSLRAIRAAGKKCGAVICPETPVRAIEPLADAGLIDEVLVMTVHPGFGGQTFLESGLPKLAEMRRRWPFLDLSVDGGINTGTGALCAAAGANILGAGSFLYKAPDMRTAIAEMREAATRAVEETAP